MYKPGDHYVICDLCGLRYYRSECKMQWDNLLACDACFDEKHPQYTEPTGKHERQKVDISRPEQTDVFITTKITGDDL